MTNEYPKNDDWHDDMLYAFDVAADAIDTEEFGGDNADRQMAAFREVAKRIRAMGKRYEQRRNSANG